MVDGVANGWNTIGVVPSVMVENHAPVNLRKSSPATSSPSREGGFGSCETFVSPSSNAQPMQRSVTRLRPPSDTLDQPQNNRVSSTPSSRPPHQPPSTRHTRRENEEEEVLLRDTRDEDKRREQEAEDAEYRERFKDLDRDNWKRHTGPRTPREPQSSFREDGEDDDGDNYDDGHDHGGNNNWRRSYQPDREVDRGREFFDRQRRRALEGNNKPSRVSSSFQQRRRGGDNNHQEQSFMDDTPRDRPRRRMNGMPDIPPVGVSDRKDEEDEEEWKSWFDMAFSHPISKRRERERGGGGGGSHQSQQRSSDENSNSNSNFRRGAGGGGGASERDNGDRRRQQQGKFSDQNYDDRRRDQRDPDENFFNDLFANSSDEDSDGFPGTDWNRSNQSRGHSQNNNMRNGREGGEGGSQKGSNVDSVFRHSKNFPEIDVRGIIDREMGKVMSDPQVRKNLSSSVETKGCIGKTGSVRCTTPGTNSFQLETQILFMNHSDDQIMVPLCVMMQRGREQPVRISGSRRPVKPGQQYVVYTADIKLEYRTRVWVDVDGSLPKDIEIIRARTHLRS